MCRVLEKTDLERTVLQILIKNIGNMFILYFLGSTGFEIETIIFTC